MNPPVLQARDLTKHYPVRRRGRMAARGAVVHAVDGVSLALSEGSITAIVGESGSGKSTLARTLARLTPPTSGEVLLNGGPVRGSRRDYARTVQMVLQDPFASLNPVHTVGYHLERPLKIHGGPPQDIGQLLDRVSLSKEFAGKYPYELSGGQRQRVAIARALAVRPAVLLADEPVSMLDVSIRLGILNLLADLREHERLAILYVTHDIASARYLADEVCVMYAGRIVESGPATVVTDSPAHPYTQLLLAAAPDPDRTGPPSLQGRGSPPSLVTPPSGCRFHPRCPFAMPVCSQQVPPAFQTGPGHLSNCWLNDDAHVHDADAPAADAARGATAGHGTAPQTPPPPAGQKGRPAQP
jgi:peptide/nickel transport system ATP-binding protein